MKVWLVEQVPPYEQGYMIAVCATKEIADVIAKARRDVDPIAVYDMNVLTEVPEEMR